MAGWFAGPKAENGEWFGNIVSNILVDYYAWRKNYFPEDTVIVRSKERRSAESFRDDFEDKLMELLSRLKADYPFQSPRYAAHMVAEQALPAIAGYFAAMLYNPNNVSKAVGRTSRVAERSPILRLCGLPERLNTFRWSPVICATICPSPQWKVAPRACFLHLR